MPTRSLRIIPDPRVELPNQGANLSLWFQKYLNRGLDQPGQALMASITKLSQQVDPVYVNYYNGWVASLQEIGSAIEVAETLGRMVVNLGAESVSEVSIALHHTYGVPLIPGTALKGLAAHYANSNMGAEWKKGTGAYKAIFGTGKTAGYVTFHDALLVPESTNTQPLKKDVVTGHHQNYNKGDDVPPADWDSPNIIPFISVHGKFLIAISGDEKAKPVAMEILRLALMNEGVGAKTNSGYGRMKFVDDKECAYPRFKENWNSGNARAERIPAQVTPMTTETYEVKKTRLIKEIPPAGQFRGTVVDVREGGNYGFISRARGGRTDFVHKSQMPGQCKVKEGQVLEYVMGSYKGKPQAQDVKILLEKD